MNWRANSSRSSSESKAISLFESGSPSCFIESARKSRSLGSWGKVTELFNIGIGKVNEKRPALPLPRQRCSIEPAVSGDGDPQASLSGPERGLESVLHMPARLRLRPTLFLTALGTLSH